MHKLCVGIVRFSFYSKRLKIILGFNSEKNNVSVLLEKSRFKCIKSKYIWYKCINNLLE